MDTDQRHPAISRTDTALSVKRQAELLDVSRSRLYRRQLAQLDVVRIDDLRIMGLIDRIHTDTPTWGYRTNTSLLRVEHGMKINRKKVRRMMRDMGIYAIYPKPNLSKRYHASHIRPYLLRHKEITAPDQVWGVDITYIHFRKGFMYLFVIIDWYSRCVVDYELSSTLDKTFVLACLERALRKAQPQIVNSDQGGHFTNPDYIRLLEQAGVKISMDGKGQCLDNARTERFFRTLKYDTVYIQEVETPRELRRMFDEYIDRYNTYRPHSALGGRRPMEVYSPSSKKRAA